MNVFLTCELGQKHRKIINNTYGNQLCDNNQLQMVWKTTFCNISYKNLMFSLLLQCPIFSLFLKSTIKGASLAVQWLRLQAFTAGAEVQSLIRELISKIPYATWCGQKQINIIKIKITIKKTENSQILNFKLERLGYR